ncbi:anti-sigma factor antagonist [Amycolatopsis sp. NPDC058340]|uniref:anti-sigma factor antagonist n=1 Tax=Amycolatopsis sp. NPDC058340 TaxID=3346453 RepID=UPI00364983EA
MQATTDPHDGHSSLTGGVSQTGDIVAATVIVTATEELADARRLEELLAPAMCSAGAVVVDLSAVAYLSMEAVVPLLALVRDCAARQRRCG